MDSSNETEDIMVIRNISRGKMYVKLSHLISLDLGFFCSKMGVIIYT